MFVAVAMKYSRKRCYRTKVSWILYNKIFCIWLQTRSS